MFLETIHNEPRVSHRVIATNTDNQAQNIKELIDDNIKDFEDFGIIRFETEKTQTQGRPQQIYYLNEPQATLLLTYLRNSDIVKKFKKALVREFYTLKNSLHVKDANALNIIADAMQTMLSQNNTMLELLKQNQKPSLADKPNTRMYHKKLSNEEKFIERVIALLKKEEGVSQKYILESLGKRADDKAGKQWLHGYHGIYWKAEYSGIGNTYSYSLIEE